MGFNTIIYKCNLSRDELYRTACWTEVTKREHERYAPLYYYKNHHHTTTTVLQPFFRDHPGEPMPEENF